MTCTLGTELQTSFLPMRVFVLEDLYPLKTQLAHEFLAVREEHMTGLQAYS